MLHGIAYTSLLSRGSAVRENSTMKVFHDFGAAAVFSTLLETPIRSIDFWSVRSIVLDSIRTKVGLRDD